MFTDEGVVITSAHKLYDSTQHQKALVAVKGASTGLKRERAPALQLQQGCW